jgi:fatty acid desaturase
MNEAVYQLASFMVLRESTPWRWSHARHHTDTIIVGRDPEIAAPRPTNVPVLLLNVFNLQNGTIQLGRILLHCCGRLTAEEATYVPASEHAKVFRIARIYALVFATVIAWSVAAGSILPLMFVGLPSFYGAWLYLVFGLTQHAGLAENVLDHRLNCRTVRMNPLFRFIYWNMNHHVEHHMFPMVPYHALPALHEAMKDDTPPAYDGLWAAYREIIPALLRQIRDPDFHVVRPLPQAARSTGPSAVQPIPAHSVT